MRRRFQEMCRTLMADDSRLLLAVSGGRDSVVLTDLFAGLDYTYEIAHCNFHLRGDDSDRDERFVRTLAEKQGVPVHVAQFDTLGYAHQHKLSIEEAARQLRYDFFEQVRQERALDYIVVAHHRDDAIETFFINLLRGTGIAGLHGIRLVNGRVVRPLLGFSRAEIDDYVERHKLQYVEDCTNASLQYRRNQVRHQLLPLLREMSPAFDATMQRTMSHLSEVESLYRERVEQCIAPFAEPSQRPDAECAERDFPLEELHKLQPLNTLLYELLRPYGFTSAQMSEVATLLEAPTGRRILSPTHTLLKDRNRLRLYPTPTAEILPGDTYCAHTIETELLPPPADLSELKKMTTATTAYFDAEKVSIPVALRHWCHGDRFTPYGMRGSQLLSDYFSDHHFSLPAKQQQPLLVDADDRILWIVGHRTSATAAVSPHTRQMLRVSITTPRES